MKPTFRKTCGLIIGRRLERLDENEKRVLAAAAVIGRSFSFRLLTEVSQIDVDELFNVIEKAQQMGIIVSERRGARDNPFTFAHELVRQTLLAGISAPRRQQLHAAVADAIESLYPGFCQRARRRDRRPSAQGRIVRGRQETGPLSGACGQECA